MRVAAPFEYGLFRTVIVRIIVLRQIRIHALFLIPDVFPFQRIPVVLKMPQHEDTPHILCTADVDAAFDRTGKDL